MYEANKINEIKVDSVLNITKNVQIPLLFSDALLKTKHAFSLVDKHLNLVDQPDSSIIFYVDESNNSQYYEYSLPLKSEGVQIFGIDLYNNQLKGLLTSEVLIFVNGQKLEKNEFEIVDDSHLRILISIPNKNFSDVVIYTSQDLVSMGSIPFDFPITTNYTMTVLDYKPNRYIFFKNGKIIPFNKITYVGATLTFNIPINLEVDRLEYYTLPAGFSAYYFEPIPGIFSYGPFDYFNSELPLCYDRIVKLNDVARLLIDDLRPGFFFREAEGIGVGILELVDEDYETKELKCLKLAEFTKDSYGPEEYFLQVPNVTSILHYLSDYDLKSFFLPEILGSFQKLLLNETYDSLLRIQNLRSIEKVNSKDITKLLDMLGNTVNVTSSSLAHKHNVLDELTKYLRASGTRKSYNFYNLSTGSGNVISIDQLYTPIKDMRWDGELVYRYQTFRTPVELGAVERTEYRFPFTDYGYVDVLANATDAVGNTTKTQTRYIGELEDAARGLIFEHNDSINPNTVPAGSSVEEYRKRMTNYFPVNYQYAIMNDTRDVYVNHEDGTTTLEKLPIEPNRYVIDPLAGPNTPTPDYDYGSVSEEAEHFIDYGRVDETIQGHWVTWLDWTRPKDWYPTNKVDILTDIPIGIERNTFMEQFLKTFYDIASAVLYIRGVVETYSIAKDDKWEQGDDIQYGIMAAPVYQTIHIVMSSDPARQMKSN